MEIIHRNNSLVIIGDSHNPTVISDTFFLKSGIISDLSDIDRNKLIITPAFCQAQLKNNTTFFVEPGRLNITSTDPYYPYDIGKKYCNSLGYIKSVAVGINIDLLVKNYDFNKWFAPLELSDYKNSRAKAISFSFNANSRTTTNVTLSRISEIESLFSFNFHTDTNNIILSELNFDFIEESKEFIKQSEDFVKSLLK